MKQSSNLNLLIWFFLLSLGIGLFILGIIGFSNYAVIHQTGTTFWDHVYLAMQLIPMNSGGLEPPIPPELNIARILIPVLTFATAIKAFFDIFTQQINFIKLGLMYDHIMICGLSRKGFLLANKFRQQGKNVVIIEKNKENLWIESCKEQGMFVLIGDASDSILLKRAGLKKARGLFVVCENDGVNAEIAIQAQKIHQNSERSLNCLVHIGEPQLCALLRQQEHHLDNKFFNLELFNIYERSARLLLDNYPAWKNPINVSTPPHILLVGLGRMGENLVLHAVQDWRTQSQQNQFKIKITIIDRKAQEKSESLLIRYPYLTQYCELFPLQIEIHSPGFEKADFIKDDQGRVYIDQIFICVDDDSLALHAGLTLQHQLQHQNIPIILRMSEESGLSQLIKNHKDIQQAYQNIYAFGLLDRACTPDLLNNTSREILARSAYEDYVYQCGLNNPSLAGAALFKPWEQLDDKKRDENYRWVDHIASILDFIGYKVIPTWNWGNDLNYFTDQQIDLMAQKEHELWCRDKINIGWQYAPGKKNEHAKTHPDLVTWNDLKETEKEKNRQFVRRLPIHLARAGYHAQPVTIPQSNRP